LTLGIFFDIIVKEMQFKK